MNFKSLVLSSLLCLMVVPVSAKGYACQAYDKSQQLDLISVQRKLLDKGYDIRSFKQKNNCFVASVIDKDGGRYKLIMDMKSGDVVEQFTKHKKPFKGAFDGQKRPQMKECPIYSEQERMSESAIQQQLLQEGYTLQAFRTGKTCFEARVKDKKGDATMLLLDMKNGSVVDSIKAPMFGKMPKRPLPIKENK